MGDAANDILSSFGLTDNEKKNYDTVVEKFQRYFVKKRNVIFERARFNQRKQEVGESVDDFVTALFCLSVKKKNVIFERARFNQRKQEEGESVDDFVTALFCLSEHCQYGNLREEMIRDRIVVGLRDSSLSEKLQLEADLTLEKALAFAQQGEWVKNQQKVVKADSSPPNVDAIQSRGKLKDKRVESKSTR